MSLDYIKRYYNVPAAVGERIEYTDSGGAVHPGQIVGADGALLKVLFDGETNSKRFHPTWNIAYLSKRDPSPLTPKDPT